MHWYHSTNNKRQISPYSKVYSNIEVRSQALVLRGLVVAPHIVFSGRLGDALVLTGKLPCLRLLSRLYAVHAGEVCGFHTRVGVWGRAGGHGLGRGDREVSLSGLVPCHGGFGGDFE